MENRPPASPSSSSCRESLADLRLERLNLPLSGGFIVLSDSVSVGSTSNAVGPLVPLRLPAMKPSFAKPEKLPLALSLVSTGSPWAHGEPPRPFPLHLEQVGPMPRRSAS